jgi:hypothetical protein
MPKTRGSGAGRLTTERGKIQASGILDVLIAYAEGNNKEMSASQVSAALGLLKKALPDLSTVALPGETDDADAAPEYSAIEIRIVDPQG